MFNLRIVGVTLIASLSILLSGCGGTETSSTNDGKVDKVTQSEKKADEDKGGASSNVDKYFDLIGKSAESPLKEAASIAAPDSVAFAYAKHLLYFTQSQISFGISQGDTPIEKTNNGYKVCDLDGDGDPSDCAFYSDFETKDGKIATFSANDVPLKGRVVLGTGDPVKAGDLAEVRFLSAYQSPFSDVLFVSIEITTRDKAIETGISMARYRNPDGRQVNAAESVGDYQVGKDSHTTNYMVFPGSKIGGKLSFEINDKNYTITKNVTIKTK